MQQLQSVRVLNIKLILLSINIQHTNQCLLIDASKICGHKLRGRDTHYCCE